MTDLHGQAILDFFHQSGEFPLIIHNQYGQPEQMPVEVFFREEEDLSTLEHLALIESKGKVLDLGAGAGAHSLILRNRGFDVVALDHSPGCIEVMKMSGLSKVVMSDYQLHQQKYDTILILMNGLGLAGRLTGVSTLLNKCVSMLNPNGQILCDSSDIAYLYEEGIEKPNGYYGELKYQYEYKGAKGDWFDWLYIDKNILAQEVSALGLNLEILYTDENDQYLACITL